MSWLLTGWTQPSRGADRQDHPVAANRNATVGENTDQRIWLPFLGGTKDAMLPMLERLAGAGFFAVSIDPWQHGERSTESPTHLRDRLIGAFRRDIWPAIDQSALDTMWVLDWITAHHDVSSSGVVAGGLSIGGDISVALAGIDQCVGRVAAIGSTPDQIGRASCRERV